MGEKSKSIGEIGENIVGSFLELIGWTGTLSSLSISCTAPKKHVSKDATGNFRSTHGLDSLFVYKSPLEASTAQHVVVSVKNMDQKYPQSATQKFKDHFEDLAVAIECYGYSELMGRQQDLITHSSRNQVTGVLIWLSGKEDSGADLVGRVKGSRIDKDLEFDTIHLVDNKQVEFIFQLMTHLRTRFDASHIKFYYPLTSLNYNDKSLARYGSILPVEFLTSPVIPFVINTSSSELSTLILASIDNFERDSLAQLMQLAKEYSSDMNCKVLILFPDYSGADHRNDVLDLLKTHDRPDHLVVSSFIKDHRSLASE